MTSVRRIPLHPQARAAIESMLAHNGVTQPSQEDLIFPTERGTPTSYANVRNRAVVPLFERANELARHAEAKARGWVPVPQGGRRGLHSFRHYGASVLVAQGMPLGDVVAFLGHSSLKMTSHYVHDLEEGDEDETA